MTRILTSLIAGFSIAIGAAATAHANTSTSGRAGAEPATSSALLSGTPVLSGMGVTGGPADQPIEIAFNRIIRVGPRGSKFSKYRCAVTINGDRYYSVGITESGARSWLTAITPQYVYCRRDHRHR